MQDLNQLAARRIRETRKTKGITQDQLAELAGLNRTHLYRLENGKQSMTLDTLAAIANALGVLPWKLLKENREHE